MKPHKTDKKEFCSRRQEKRQQCFDVGKWPSAFTVTAGKIQGSEGRVVNCV